MKRPSPRALIATGGALLAVALLVVGGWLWYAAGQRDAAAAYAVALVKAQPAQSAQAPPETRSLAIQELETVLARYPSAPGAPQAALELGNLRYARGDYAGARAAWEIALTKASAGSPTIRVLAGAAMGYAWEAEQKYERAAAAYRSALAGLGRGDFLYEQLLVNLARVQELAGQKAEAVETYRKVLTEIPQTRRSDEIRARLLALGAS